MKKIHLTFVMLLFAFIAHSQIFQLKGVVYSSDNRPLEGCIVGLKESTNENKSQVVTVTNINGYYSLEAEIGDTIEFKYPYHETFIQILENTNELNVKLMQVRIPVGDVLTTSFVSSSVSTRNFWVGSKIGYNFAGNTAEDFFVGSASIALNLFDNKDSHNTFGVIGNIGNFKFNKDTADSKNIQKLAQSINGLFVGLGYTHETAIVGASKNSLDQYPISYFREFITSGARLTTYTNVGQEKLTLNFPQFVTTAGLEFEQTGFKNGGSITASMGVSLYLFDKMIYKDIFEEEKGKLITLDFTVILPIAKNMGFFINGTFAKKTPASYILGIIFKPTQI